MTSTEERYAQRLRERVEAVAPRVDVDLERVVPRARRRRAVVRGGVGATTLALVLAAGWGAGAAFDVVRPPAVPPAGPVVPAPAPAPSDEASAPEPERPTVPVEAVVAEDGSVSGVPGDPWEGDERWWYSVTESRSAVRMDDGPWTLGDVERRETWTSRERPGVWVSDGDVEHASAAGPRVVLGSWVVAGVRYDMLADPRVLPVEADELGAVVRESLEPDRGAGTDDDKVYGRVRDALSEGALLASELRHAFWEVAAALPGATVSTGQDGAGRPGQVLRWTDSSGAVRVLVRDTATGLLLEESAPDQGTYLRYLEQGPSDEVPVEPTLALAGCVDWATC